MYEDTTVELLTGDVLVFYTDGLYEARHWSGPYGFERLQRVIQEGGGAGSAGDILDRILADVEGFLGEAPHEDDMTLVVVKVGGPDSRRSRHVGHTQPG